MKYLNLAITFLLFIIGNALALNSDYNIILAYHKFSPSSDKDINIYPEEFERQMEYLKINNYKVIKLEELVERIRKKRTIAKTVVITIDDRDPSVYEYAFPILKKYNYPATFFVTVNMEGISWRKLREMDKKGVDIQSHTYNHTSLIRNIDEESKSSYLRRLKEELYTSKTLLEKYLNKKIKYLAPPHGNYDKDVIKKAKKYGYEAICGFANGVNTLKSDLFNLKRQAITLNTTLEKFATILNTKPLNLKYIYPKPFSRI